MGIKEILQKHDREVSQMKEEANKTVKNIMKDVKKHIKNWRE